MDSTGGNECRLQQNEIQVSFCDIEVLKEIEKVLKPSFCGSFYKCDTNSVVPAFACQREN